MTEDVRGDDLRLVVGRMGVGRLIGHITDGVQAGYGTAIGTEGPAVIVDGDSATLSPRDAGFGQPQIVGVGLPAGHQNPVNLEHASVGQPEHVMPIDVLGPCGLHADHHPHAVGSELIGDRGAHPVRLVGQQMVCDLDQCHLRAQAGEGLRQLATDRPPPRMPNRPGRSVLLNA